jgi:hypothetical protein
VAGTSGNPGGTDGSYSFTVTLSKGAGEPQTTNTLYLTVTATPYGAQSLADAINSSYPGLSASVSGNMISVTGEYTGTGLITLGTTSGMSVIWSAAYDGYYPLTVNGGGTLTVGSGSSIVNSSGGTALTSDGDVIVDGGMVMANGDGAAAVETTGGVTVNRGAVIAEGSDGTAIDAGGDISLYGGTVSSRGENGCAAVSAKTITLDGNCAVISKEPLFGGGVITAKGLLIEGDNGMVYGAVRLDEPGELGKNISVPGGATLTIPSGASLTVSGGVTLLNNGEIAVHSGGTLINNGVIENNGGTITGYVEGARPTENPVPVFTAEHGEILDRTSDAGFVINWNLSAMRSLTINGNAIAMTPSAGGVKRILSGYPGYSGDIGEVVSGSTEITLYGPFVNHISPSGRGRQTMSANFGEGYDVSTAFTIQTLTEVPGQSGDGGTQSGEGGGGGGCDAGAGIAGLFALAALFAEAKRKS